LAERHPNPALLAAQDHTNGPTAPEVAAVAGTNDGGRPTAFLADEVHERLGNKRRVHLVLSNGCAKRVGSRVLNTMTPGCDLSPKPYRSRSPQRKEPVT